MNLNKNHYWALIKFTKRNQKNLRRVTNLNKNDPKNFQYLVNPFKTATKLP